jgi:predicted amidophosphoribosyltransferase
MALLGRPPAGVPEGVVVALPYAGRVRDIMLGLKYRNRRAVARHLAGLLVNRLVAEGLHDDYDAVTWAPTTGSHRRQRGFDQAEVIARTAARQLHLPSRRLLVRRGGGSGQTGRSRSERLHAPDFAARPGVAGLRVLLVDDVVTTGSTLQAACTALEQAGAEVVPAAVAATPTPAMADAAPRGSVQALAGRRVA